MDSESVIYGLVDPRKGVIYVGRTIDLERRTIEHRADRRALIEELESLGLDLEVRVLQRCSNDDAPQAERTWASKYVDAAGNPSPMSEVGRQRMRHLVFKVGDKEAAKQLGIGRATVARVLAGLPLTPGTKALIWEKFPRDNGEPAKS